MRAGTRAIGRSGDIRRLRLAEHQRTGVPHDAVRLGAILERSRGTRPEAVRVFDLWPLISRVFSPLSLVRTDIPDVRPTPVPADHVQPGHIPPAVQRDPVLGHHRDMPVAEHIKADEHTEENDQTGHVVSTPPLVASVRRLTWTARRPDRGPARGRARFERGVDFEKSEPDSLRFKKETRKIRRHVFGIPRKEKTVLWPYDSTRVRSTG